VLNEHQAEALQFVEHSRLSSTPCLGSSVDAVLDADFAKLYAADGRPSIAPERLLRLQVSAVRHERRRL